MTAKKPKSQWKRMGRPTLDNPRAVFVSVRLTPQEREELKKTAKAAGLSVPAFIRKRILEG